LIRQPALLDAQLKEVVRLPALSQPTTLNMVGTSEATLILPDDAPAVRIHDWISLYTRRGFAGIFRVSNVAQALRNQTEVTLLHGNDILADSVWAEQFDFVGTKAEFITRLLNQQTHLINNQRPWVLGTCADTSTYKRSINYDRLSNLLAELVEEGGDYWFTYDMTTFPWRVNYVARDQAVTSEFRVSRNIRSATITYNDADQCTRLHLSINVKDEASEVTSTDTIIKTYDNAAAQAEWGVIVKTADIDTADAITIDPPITTEADAWAARFLAARAQPTVQIQIDGDELKDQTGDDWDEADLGRLCRVALPDYGHSFEERVISIAYQDALKEESHVSVSLANNLPRFSETIAMIRDEAERASRSARGAGRSAADAKELLTWSQHVSYYGLALDGTGIMTLYESGIDMDAAGGVTIYSLQNGLQALYSGIQVNTGAITSEVSRASAAEGALSSRITQTADQISLKVSKGQVKTELAVECGNVRIVGGNLVIDGMVTTSELETAIAAIDTIVGDLQVNGAVTVGGNLYVDAITLGDGRFTKVCTSASVDGDKLTLTFSNGTTVNFSKATPTSLSGAWSGGILTITASPGTLTTTANLTMPVAGLPNHPEACRVSAYDNTVEGSGARGDTGATRTLYLYANTETVSIRTASGGGGDAVASIPNPAVGTGGIASTGSWVWDTDGEVYTRTITANNGAEETIGLPTITATAGNFANHVSIVTVTGPGGHAVASAIVNASGEYTAGQNSVNVSKGDWSGGVATFSPSAGTGTGSTLTLTTNAAGLSNHPEACQVTVMDSSTSTSVPTGAARTLYLHVDSANSVAQIRTGSGGGGSAIASVAIPSGSGEGGITSVTPGGWVYDSTRPYLSALKNVVTATAKNGETMTADVAMPTISLGGMGLGTTGITSVWGLAAAASGTNYTVTTAKNLWLKADDSYCYICNSNATPTVGSNVIARIDNPKDSAATTLTGAWDTTTRKYTVTAMPQNKKISTTVGLKVYDGWGDDGEGKMVQILADNNAIYTTYIPKPSPNLQTLETIKNNGTYSFDASQGYEGLNTVVVDVPNGSDAAITDIEVLNTNYVSSTNKYVLSLRAVGTGVTAYPEVINVDASDAFQAGKLSNVRLQSKDATLSTRDQVIYPSSSYDGLSDVYIPALPSISAGSVTDTNTRRSADIERSISTSYTYHYITVSCGARNAVIGFRTER